jgi:aspartyl protease family protein
LDGGFNPLFGKGSEDRAPMLKIALSFVVLAVLLMLAAPDIVARLSAVTQPRQQELPAEPGAPARVMVAADSRGHYQTEFNVNGRPLKAMVDTGASAVALTYEDGRALGLIRPGDRFDVPIQTGNGTIEAKRVFLNTVRVGGITAHNVEAIVMPEGALGVNLLGMTFLKKLKGFEIKNGRLILEQ